MTSSSSFSLLSNDDEDDEDEDEDDDEEEDVTASFPTDTTVWWQFFSLVHTVEELAFSSMTTRDVGAAVVVVLVKAIMMALFVVPIFCLVISKCVMCYFLYLIELVCCLICKKRMNIIAIAPFVV